MTVAILGKSKWQWGSGHIVVVQVDGRYFTQCDESDDQTQADEVEPTTAMGLLTGRRRVWLTGAGREWMREQRALRAKFEQSERRTI